MVWMICASLALGSFGSPAIEWVGTPPATGDVGEVRILNVPSVANPYDTDQIRVTLQVHGADGSLTRVPAFYYRPMTRSISEPYESIIAQGGPEWRARFTPIAPGRLELSARVEAAGSSAESNRLAFVPKRKPYLGFVRRSASDPLALQFQDGTMFRAIGENLCWPGTRGTYDYDIWIPSLKASGANYVRLWCSPWYFGFEVAPGQLLNYNQRPLWALDYVMKALKDAGIGVILCLEYPGMLETKPDYWGGGDDWKLNPYNRANGGPCENPNAFFTNPTAKEIYKKRLTYLVARYSAFPNLVAWEFWNEIDNVISYLNQPDVVNWHAEMAAYLKAADPYQHLVTTSLSWMQWPELWSLSGLDFTQMHSYNLPNPGRELHRYTQIYASAFSKPVIVGEFGIDWRGFAQQEDPYGRGLRQALWTSLASLGFGTAQFWYWQQLHANNFYPNFAAVSNVVRNASRGENWSVAALDAPGLDDVLGDLDPSGTPFDVVLYPNTYWGAMLSGRALLRDEWTGAFDAVNLNAFVHGTWKPDLRIPCKISGHFAPGASMTLHLNSVSDQCWLVVKVNESVVYSRFLPNKDGLYQVNNEYDEDIVIPLPAGRNDIEIVNPGGDWLYYDWLKFAKVLPSKRVSPGVPVLALGSGNSREAWVWLLDYAASFPNNAKRAEIRNLEGVEVTLRNLEEGLYEVTWHDTRTGLPVRVDTVQSSSGALRLAPPTFSEDIFAWIEPKGRRYVSGHVTPQDWLDSNPVPSSMQAKVLLPGTSTVVGECPVVVDPWGGFRFQLPALPGVYDVRFKMSHWLSAKVRIDASAGHVQNLDVRLPNGDVNGDNRVDTLDWNALSAAFRSRPGNPRWNPNADLNGDSVVDALDFNILSKNWRRQGE